MKQNNYVHLIFLAVTGIIISAAELVDCICQTVALNGNVIPKIEEKVKINSRIATSLLNVLNCA